jgi:hypothetical protein
MHTQNFGFELRSLSRRELQHIQQQLMQSDQSTRSISRSAAVLAELEERQRRNDWH